MNSAYALAFIKSVPHAGLCYDEVAEKQVAAFGIYSHICIYIYIYMCVISIDKYIHILPVTCLDALGYTLVNKLKYFY